MKRLLSLLLFVSLLQAMEQTYITSSDEIEIRMPRLLDIIRNTPNSITFQNVEQIERYLVALKAAIKSERAMKAESLYAFALQVIYPEILRQLIEDELSVIELLKVRPLPDYEILLLLLDLSPAWYEKSIDLIENLLGGPAISNLNKEGNYDQAMLNCIQFCLRLKIDQIKLILLHSHFKSFWTRFTFMVDHASGEVSSEILHELRNDLSKKSLSRMM